MDAKIMESIRDLVKAVMVVNDSCMKIIDLYIDNTKATEAEVEKAETRYMIPKYVRTYEWNSIDTSCWRKDIAETLELIPPPPWENMQIETDAETEAEDEPETEVIPDCPPADSQKKPTLLEKQLERGWFYNELWPTPRASNFARFLIKEYPKYKEVLEGKRMSNELAFKVIAQHLKKPAAIIKRVNPIAVAEKIADTCTGAMALLSGNMSELRKELSMAREIGLPEYIVYIGKN
jgi:hypothetical protein